MLLEIGHPHAAGNHMGQQQLLQIVLVLGGLPP
jgi:hypothetical protein